MICYKDRTFCSSEGEHTCGREITPEEIREAERMGLPIAYSEFCNPPPNEPNRTGLYK
jgi:hypothetical protein